MGAWGAMPRKTFISYKYREARTVRDRILRALGADATYYQGETSESPDLTVTSTENINTLTAMMLQLKAKCLKGAGPS